MSGIITRLEALEQRLRPTPTGLPAQVLQDLERIYGTGTPAQPMTWAQVDAAIERIYSRGTHEADSEAPEGD